LEGQKHFSEGTVFVFIIFLEQKEIWGALPPNAPPWLRACTVQVAAPLHSVNVMLCLSLGQRDMSRSGANVCQVATLLML